MTHILVVGGAGYIGAHMVLALQEAGYTPVVFDNLSRGRSNLISGVPIFEGELADKHLLEKVFAAYSFSAVMHFASLIEVAESIQFPAKYYHNNVLGTLYLLDAMLAHAVKNIVFSSSAAVYGNPNYLPIDEAHPLGPINPYGRTKRMVEEIIADYAVNGALHYAILRYFNAAGADPNARVGEHHQPESHLLPLLLQAAAGKRENITIYGSDYATSDGTCVRDYVHVTDICAAHLLALNALQDGANKLLYNLGSGAGFSVQQVINAVSHVTGKNIAIQRGLRRNGDPAVLVANNTQARNELSWQPRYSELEIMVAHAWQFMQKSF